MPETETDICPEMASQLPVRKLNRKRGMSALFTVLVFLAVFAIFTSAVGNLAIQRMRSSSRAVLQQRATYACEAGFVWATEWLEQQITYNNAANSLTMGPFITANFNNMHTLKPLSSDPDVKVTVRIVSNLLGPTNITGPDGVNIDPGQVYVTTLGQVGDGLAPASSRHLGGLACLGTQNYPYAIQAEGPITLRNSRISTFTSFNAADPSKPLAMFWQYHWITKGWRGFPPHPYVDLHGSDKRLAMAALGDGGAGATPMPSNFAQAARLASNARVNAVNTTGSMVDGQLFFGPGGTLATAVSENPAPSWASPPPAPAALPAPLYITKYKPPVDPSTTVGHNHNGSLSVASGTYYNNVTINGGTLNLNCNSPGTNEFYFAGALNLTNCDVNLQGVNRETRAKVYLGQKLILNNCRVNRDTGSWSPREAKAHTWSFNLSFLGCGAGGPPSSPSGQTIVNITNNSAVFGLFAGSAMNLTISDSLLGGALKCGSVNMTNTNMLYDVGVNTNIPGVYDATTTLWGRVAWTMTGVTDYGPSLYRLAQGGLPGGALAPAGPGAAGALLGGAASSANLGGNSGPAVGGPLVTGSSALGGTGAGSAAAGTAASGSAAAVVNSSPSFWASLFLGQ